MATASETTGKGHPRLLVAALVVLVGATSAAFGRVFLGSAPAARLVIAAVIAVLIAAALERRHVALWLGATAAALLAVIGLMVFPRTTWWAGLPTPGTVEAIVTALGNAGGRAAEEIAPAPALPSLMTASLIAVWAAASASHALAARSRSPVLALVPPAALLAFAGVVSEDGSRPAYAVAFLVGAVAVLFAGGVQRMGAWGALTASRGRTIGAAMARGAQALGATAVIVALAAPGLLPGFGSDPLVDLEGGRSGLGVSPIVDIRPTLLQNPPAELFTVRASRPAYWRLLTLDRFDGRMWRASDVEAERGIELEGQTRVAGQMAVEGVLLQQRIHIEELSTKWLPAAAEPVSVQLDDGVVARYDREAGFLAAEDATTAGTTYGVTSFVPSTKPHTLRAMQPSKALAARYLHLPASIPRRIHGIARDVTAGAQTPFDALMAIQHHLRSFVYDEAAPAGHGIDDMLFFLERSRRGYCEQFAGTMAVLARSLGFPSRVAIGFLPGTRDRTGAWHVDSSQIHAWPEIHFPGYGWLAFEPTPERDNPSAQHLTEVVGVQDFPNIVGAAAGIGGAVAGGFGQRGQFERSAPAGNEAAGPDGSGEERGRPAARIALAVLALAAAAALGVALVKVAGRRVALRRAGSARRRVIVAWRTFEAGASDLGMGRLRGETLPEYAGRLGGDVRFSDGHLERIATLTGRALYSDRPVDRVQAGEAVAASRTLLGDVRRHAGPLRAAVAAIRPSRPL